MEKVVEGFGGMEEWRKCSNFVGGKSGEKSIENKEK